MKEILDLLQKSEDHLAQAKIAIEQIDSGNFSEVMVRCRSLAKQQAECAESLRERKQWLLQGLVETVLSIKKPPMMFSINIPQLGELRLNREPCFPIALGALPSMTCWEFANGRHPSRYFYEACKALIGVIEEYVSSSANAISNELQKETVSFKELSSKLQKLAEILDPQEPPA